MTAEPRNALEAAPSSSLPDYITLAQVAAKPKISPLMVCTRDTPKDSPE